MAFDRQAYSSDPASSITAKQAEAEQRTLESITNDLLMPNHIVELIEQGGKKRRVRKVSVRNYTLEELKQLSTGSLVWRGTSIECWRWKITSVKTWKKAENAHRIEIGLKYGLYETDHMRDFEDCQRFLWKVIGEKFEVTSYNGAWPTHIELTTESPMRFKLWRKIGERI